MFDPPKHPEPTPADTADSPSSVVAGNYRLEQELGRGGMGVVYRGLHLKLGTRAAIKVLGTVEDDRSTARFLREARLIARIDHPNVVRVLDVGECSNGRPYMAMELLEGEDLAACLKRGRGPDWPQLVDWLRQICRGLAAAHRHGVVHRDIKPSNCFLAVGPDGQVCVKLLDFGVARAPAELNDAITQSGAFVGTLQYMSPEQATNDAPHPAMDIYALGAVIHEVVSGSPPFRGDHFVETLEDVLYSPPPPLVPRPGMTVPPGLAPLVAQTLSKSVADRPKSIDELWRAIAELDGEEVGPSPVDRPRTHRRWPWFAAAGLFAMSSLSYLATQGDGGRTTGLAATPPATRSSVEVTSNPSRVSRGVDPPGRERRSPPERPVAAEARETGSPLHTARDGAPNHAPIDAPIVEATRAQPDVRELRDDPERRSSPRSTKPRPRRTRPGPTISRPASARRGSAPAMPAALAQLVNTCTANHAVPPGLELDIEAFVEASGRISAARILGASRHTPVARCLAGSIKGTLVPDLHPRSQRHRIRIPL